MISKEKFVNYINFIKSLEEKECKLQDHLEECFGRDNVGYIFIYNDVVPKIIELLCDNVGIEYNGDPYCGDDIQYFIYELDFGTKKFSNEAIEKEDGSKVDLSSAEKLYDYLVDLSKENISK